MGFTRGGGLVIIHIGRPTDAADTAGTGFIFLIYQKRPFQWKSTTANVPYDSRMSANGHDLTP